MVSVKSVRKTGASKPSQRKSTNGKSKDDLRSAVRSLGGDDADLELLKGVESDNEEAAGKKGKKGKGKAGAAEVRQISYLCLRDPFAQKMLHCDLC